MLGPVMVLLGSEPYWLRRPVGNYRSQCLPSAVGIGLGSQVAGWRRTHQIYLAYLEGSCPEAYLV